MREAVIWARVSSLKQEDEGYSIPAQVKLLRGYAAAKGFKVVKEFICAESASGKATRKVFEEMVKFFQQNPNSRVVIVEKTDRLYRNFRDCVTLEDLGVEIHLAKEGQVLDKDSKSQARLVHGIHLVIARNTIDNLREEVKKGMREKAEQGIYPTRAKFGYRNNKISHTIEEHPENAPVLRLIFETFATGNCSILELRKKIKQETGRAFTKSHLHQLLRDPFYSGVFMWAGKMYQGTHPLIIDPALFRRVQEILDSKSRPRKQKHSFPFAGFLACHKCGCALTAEIKKGKYVYYHCTGYHGKCGLPYFREEDLANKLGECLKHIHVPEAVVNSILSSLDGKRAIVEEAREGKIQRLNQRLADLKRRCRQAYQDKLDGKITEEFWTEQNASWQEEQGNVILAINELTESESEEIMLISKRILELANKACFLYLTRNRDDQAKLLKMVLSNCEFDGVNIYPTYRKPFDRVFEHAKSENWLALEDDLRTSIWQGFESERSDFEDLQLIQPTGDAVANPPILDVNAGSIGGFPTQI